MHCWLHIRVTYLFISESAVFHQLVFTLFGLYTWEVLTTWDFEWSLLTGRRTFRWPLVSRLQQMFFGLQA